MVLNVCGQPTCGVYVYNVPVCVPPLVSGCPTSELTITVADHLNPVKRPVANVTLPLLQINTAVITHFSQ
ncbi:MAG: hypothetical protein IPJ51_11175 [Saprospiraceae bacterium]|nr:hypothetical protein [Saprospiraceae bacterium]